jgi:hypothetical protein
MARVVAGLLLGSELERERERERERLCVGLLCVWKVASWPPCVYVREEVVGGDAL